MDSSKIDRLYAALASTWIFRCTEEDATATEAMVATGRLFSQALAAYVMDPDRTWDVLTHEIERHCREAQTMAKARLRLLIEHERWSLSGEEDADPV